MKRIFTLCLLVACAFGTSWAQTLDEDLKAKAAELADAQAVVDGLASQVADLEAQIEKNAGWITGYSGNIGFDFNDSNGWIASPNPESSSSGLSISLAGWANNINENNFWRNKGLLTKAWSDIDLSSSDLDNDDDNLFDNGTVDILNLSSLYGVRLSPHWAASGLAELNTSIENFLEPGTFDIGVGVTWTPDIDDLVVVIHPFNYHIAFPAEGAAFDTRGALGAKIRADYNRNFGKFAYNSTLTSFVPYSGGDENDPSLFEWTWINGVSFNIWNGIGVGFNFGLRRAEFETPIEGQDDLQSYFTVGLAYTL